MNPEHKVITTMIIMPLDKHAYCVRSTFTHMGLRQKLYDFKAYNRSQKMPFSNVFCDIFVDL